jgi:uncharacterized membrane protein (UPF0127 family)
MPNPSRRRFIAGTAVIIGIAVTAGATAIGQIRRLQTFEKDKLAIRTKAGRHEFNIEIARRRHQHAQGLMFRRHLAADAGMLFLYRETQRASMWMKNTYVPLDMIYIDRQGTIVGYYERAIPGSLEVITSKHPVNAVLEVNSGTVSRLKIAVGDKVIHSAFEAKK